MLPDVENKNGQILVIYGFFLPETGSGFFGSSRGISRYGFDKKGKNVIFITNYGFFEQFVAKPHVGTLLLVTIWWITQCKSADGSSWMLALAGW